MVEKNKIAIFILYFSFLILSLAQCASFYDDDDRIGEDVSEFFFYSLLENLKRKNVIFKIFSF